MIVYTNVSQPTSSELKHFTKLDWPFFPLPVATKKGTVCHLRGPVCLEWLCVCLLRVSAGARYIAGSLSGSGVGASDGHPIRLVS